MKQKEKFNYIVGGLVILLLIYGGTHGWFKDVYNMSPSPSNVTPSPSTTYTTCTQVCTNQGFNSGYSFVNSCNVGETKIVYGYSGQIPLLTCCCSNTISATCTDSDGDDRDTVGHVTYNGETYTDKCSDVGQAVTEYICENNQVKTKNWMCDYGEVCMQTRSGGHCIPAPNTWSPGETVFQGSGTGSITGGTLPVTGSLDLTEYGLTPGGSCQLGLQVSTSWNYDNPVLCTGMQGIEGLKWDFFDSAGLEYTRVDPSPLALGVDLHPTQHYLEWDGQTDWRFMVSKLLNLPNCNINYEWSARVYIYSCT